jgi:hypothetical protein
MNGMIWNRSKNCNESLVFGVSVKSALGRKNVQGAMLGMISLILGRVTLRGYERGVTLEYRRNENETSFCTILEAFDLCLSLLSERVVSWTLFDVLSADMTGVCDGLMAVLALNVISWLVNQMTAALPYLSTLVDICM